MRLRFNPELHGHRVKVAANTVVQVVGRGVSAVSSFIITILIARHFGVEAYGELTKILAFTAFFYLAADFGLNAITVKELSSQAGRAKGAQLQTLFSTRIILGVALMWLAVMATVFLPFSPETGEGFSRLVKLGIILFAPTILLQALIRSTNAYFQSKLRYDNATIAIIVGSIVGLALVSGIVYLQISSILIVAATLMVALFAQTSVAFILFKRLLHTPLGFSFNLPHIVSLLKKSLPLGLTLVLNIAFFRLDIFLLAIFRSTTEVGLYGLAYKFFEFPLVIPTFFMNAVYPVLVGSARPRLKIIKSSALFLLASSLVLGTIFYILSPHITLIKSDFAGSVALFRILTLWLPLFFLSSLFMWVAIAKEQHWKLAGIYAAGLAVNTVLNLLFIPSHGATAAAITTGITELFILVLLLTRLNRTDNFYQSIKY